MTGGFYRLFEDEPTYDDGPIFDESDNEVDDNEELNLFFAYDSSTAVETPWESRPVFDESDMDECDEEVDGVLDDVLDRFLVDKSNVKFTEVTVEVSGKLCDEVTLDKAVELCEDEFETEEEFHDIPNDFDDEFHDVYSTFYDDESSDEFEECEVVFDDAKDTKYGEELCNVEKDVVALFEMKTSEVVVVFDACVEVKSGLNQFDGNDVYEEFSGSLPVPRKLVLQYDPVSDYYDKMRLQNGCQQFHLKPDNEWKTVSRRRRKCEVGLFSLPLEEDNPALFSRRPPPEPPDSVQIVEVELGDDEDNLNSRTNFFQLREYDAARVHHHNLIILLSRKYSVSSVLTSTTFYFTPQNQNQLTFSLKTFGIKCCFQRITLQTYVLTPRPMFASAPQNYYSTYYQPYHTYFRSTISHAFSMIQIIQLLKPMFLSTLSIFQNIILFLNFISSTHFYLLVHSSRTKPDFHSSLIHFIWLPQLYLRNHFSPQFQVFPVSPSIPIHPTWLLDPSMSDARSCVVDYFMTLEVVC